VAQEFVPLNQLVALVLAEIRIAGERLEQQRGEVGFVLGECSVTMAVELRTDGEVAMARSPSLGEHVPAELVSRVSIALRPSAPFSEGR
jgi:hypothetical protein